jgi:uncharacterized protein (UPF0332 family)
MAKARESSASAKADLEAGRLYVASSRAYCAMFHAARAALEMRGIATGGERHGTIIGRFGRTFVKHGPSIPLWGGSSTRRWSCERRVTTILRRPTLTTFERCCKNAEALVDAISELFSPDDA